jgi:hypothetical protein
MKLHKRGGDSGLAPSTEPPLTDEEVEETITYLTESVDVHEITVKEAKPSPEADKSSTADL